MTASVGSTDEIRQADIDALDVLDDDEFRGVVARRLDTDPGNKRLWRMLSHPTLIDRTLGCLEELADEIAADIKARQLPPVHGKVKRLNVINKRIEMCRAVEVRVTGQIRTVGEEVVVYRKLVRQLGLAVDAHRLACIGLDLAPEPHDLVLWEMLDGLRLPAYAQEFGPTLAEQIAAGHWRHEV